MKVYSAYKPMILDNEADAAPAATEKTAASGRQEKSKVDNISSFFKSLKGRASYEKPSSQSCGVSFATWDCTVLPASQPTQMKASCLNPSQTGRDSLLLPRRLSS